MGAGALIQQRLSFRAMGTDITVLLVSGQPDEGAKALDDVRRLFEADESRFSRFRSDSELSRLNETGLSEDPSDEMWDVLTRAQAWWRWSSGVFDPAVLGALEAAGYDTSFERIQARVEGKRPPPSPVSFANVEFRETPAFRSIRLHNGARVDFGGIVKGWTVDRAAGLLSAFPGYLVDAGGDIRAGGVSPDGPGWCVSVEDPLQPGTDRWCFFLHDEAVATSGTYRRRWTANGRQAHHLIDPATGAPSRTSAVSATVKGTTAESCEVMAKVALLAGTEAGVSLIEQSLSFEGVVHGSDGVWRCSSGWAWQPLIGLGSAS